MTRVTEPSLFFFFLFSLLLDMASPFFQKKVCDLGASFFLAVSCTGKNFNRDFWLSLYQTGNPNIFQIFKHLGGLEDMLEPGGTIFIPDML